MHEWIVAGCHDDDIIRMRSRARATLDSSTSMSSPYLKLVQKIPRSPKIVRQPFDRLDGAIGGGEAAT